ncbi:hypothetical protein NON00_02280 [Roseomonas sp. GC11]|uniref:hypothetical protein n=1 Tax=Roseomonas sp. GC11 TaxID=2950546 RepID=UPI00210A8C48|nr:hypothetical protein [Roseomonas sp. GC11]MCQ4158754.1 hypothetical protein [Roseomonas sp. GC11]
MADNAPPLAERLARIEAKIDMILATGQDHEARLRTMEGDRAKLMGAAGVLGAIASYLAQHFKLPFGT